MLRVIIISLFFISSVLFSTVNAAELIEGVFESGGHKFSFEGVSIFKYPFLVLDKKPTLLVTHSSIYWDQNHATWPGTEALIEAFKKNNLTYKYLAAIEERSTISDAALKSENKYFPGGITVGDLYPFQGDSHRMIATHSDIVISGGNFTICACSTVRSIIALAETTEPLRIHFAMDAIYEGQNGKLLRLSEISDRYNDQEFLNYLRENYFNEDTLPCKEASLFALDRKFSYDVYRNKKFLGHLFSHLGGSDNRVVLDFKSSAEIIQQISN